MRIDRIIKLKSNKPIEQVAREAESVIRFELKDDPYFESVIATHVVSSDWENYRPANMTSSRPDLDLESLNRIATRIVERPENRKEVEALLESKKVKDFSDIELYKLGAYVKHLEYAYKFKLKKFDIRHDCFKPYILNEDGIGDYTNIFNEGKLYFVFAELNFKV